MKHKIKRSLTSVVMALALIVSVFAGVVPLGSITAGAADPDYLTFTGEEDGSSVTVKRNTGSFQFNKNNSGWSSYTAGTKIQLDNGDSVSFRGNNNGKQLFNSSSHVTIDGKVACSGNVMTLLDYNDPDNAQMGTYCFMGMFSGCEGLTTAPNLPATTLAQGCYNGMFYGCKSLTTAPELPATRLAKSCYSIL